MNTTVFTISTRHVSHSASRINNQSELLRRRPNPQPRRIVAVGEEVVVKPHAGVGSPRAVGFLKTAALEIPAMEGGFGGGEVERKDRRPAAEIGASEVLGSGGERVEEDGRAD